MRNPRQFTKTLLSTDPGQASTGFMSVSPILTSKKMKKIPFRATGSLPPISPAEPESIGTLDAHQTGQTFAQSQRTT